MPKCPKCNIPLCRVEIQRVPVHTCPDCGGELVEDLRLKAIERRADPTWTEEQKDAFCRLADQSNDLGDILCPRCSRVMNKFLFRSYANLQVDQCSECHCYWLDAGEMEKMQIFYQEEMASRTEEDWDRIERRALAEIAHDERLSEYRSLRDNADPTAALVPGTPHRSTQAGGGLLGLAFGLWSLDRRLQKIDDHSTQALDGSAGQGPAARAFSSKPASLIGLIVALLILGGIIWLLTVLQPGW